MNGTVHAAFNRDQTRVAFRLQHPKGNLITADIIEALRQGLETAAQNPHLKLITIEGDGPDFSFGASIPEHAPDAIGHVLPAAHQLTVALLEAPCVTAALVRGRCLGGGFEIALACDVILADTSAQFGLPEIALGVFPPAGSALLQWRVAGARAASAILTGLPQPAAWWHQHGLIEQVVEPGRLESAADAWFECHLAPRSASSLRYACAAARLGLRQQVSGLLPELERLYLDDLMRTEDAVEGIRAFLERRPARWTDK